MAFTGCAVLKVDIDAYKGPLARERNTQLQELGAHAVGLRPLLVQARDRNLAIAQIERYNREVRGGIFEDKIYLVPDSDTIDRVLGAVRTHYADAGVSESLRQGGVAYQSDLDQINDLLKQQIAELTHVRRLKRSAAKAGSTKTGIELKGSKQVDQSGSPAAEEQETKSVPRRPASYRPRDEHFVLDDHPPVMHTAQLLNDILGLYEDGLDPSAMSALHKFDAAQDRLRAHIVVIRDTRSDQELTVATSAAKRYAKTATLSQDVPNENTRYIEFSVVTEKDQLFGYEAMYAENPPRDGDDQQQIDEKKAEEGDIQRDLENAAIAVDELLTAALDFSLAVLDQHAADRMRDIRARQLTDAVAATVAELVELKVVSVAPAAPAAPAPSTKTAYLPFWPKVLGEAKDAKPGEISDCFARRDDDQIRAQILGWLSSPDLLKRHERFAKIRKEHVCNDLGRIPIGPGGVSVLSGLQVFPLLDQTLALARGPLSAGRGVLGINSRIDAFTLAWEERNRVRYDGTSSNTELAVAFEEYAKAETELTDGLTFFAAKIVALSNHLDFVNPSRRTKRSAWNTMRDIGPWLVVDDEQGAGEVDLMLIEALGQSILLQAEHIRRDNAYRQRMDNAYPLEEAAQGLPRWPMFDEDVLDQDTMAEVKAKITETITKEGEHYDQDVTVGRIAETLQYGDRPFDASGFQSPADVLNAIEAYYRGKLVRTLGEEAHKASLNPPPDTNADGVPDRSMGESERALRYRRVLAEINRQRERTIPLQFPAAYLASSYAVSSLDPASDPEQQNLLFESLGRATIPGSRADWSKELQQRIDARFWQTINEVRLSGFGQTNFVVVKDALGNYVTKQYSANPSQIYETMALGVRAGLLGGLDTGRIEALGKVLDNENGFDPEALKTALGAPTQAGEATAKFVEQQRQAERNATGTLHAAFMKLGTDEERAQVRVNAIEDEIKAQNKLLASASDAQKKAEDDRDKAIQLAEDAKDAWGKLNDQMMKLQPPADDGVSQDVVVDPKVAALQPQLDAAKLDLDAKLADVTVKSQVAVDSKKSVETLTALEAELEAQKAAAENIAGDSTDENEVKKVAYAQKLAERLKLDKNGDWSILPKDQQTGEIRLTSYLLELATTKDKLPEALFTEGGGWHTAAKSLDESLMALKTKLEGVATSF
ncbi:MAG: hypothetical protein AAGH92_11275 [Planctomycetota bacterium]